MKVCSSEQSGVIAVHAPKWRGVTAATQNLFSTTVAMPASPDRHPGTLALGEIEACAEQLLEMGARHVVHSGGEVAQIRLAAALRARDPRVRSDVLWHGTYVQLREDEEWEAFNACIVAGREGTVTKVGTVKKGMVALFRSLGCRSDFVMNFVPEIPAAGRRVEAAGWHIGLWPSNTAYRKLPHTVLVALSYLDDVTLHAANLDQRCRDLVKLLGVPTGLLADDVLPRHELMHAIAATHLTLSVTFAEACPMLPLESFSIGVPCLLGPTSHLFEEHRYLHEVTVVPYPDRAEVVAAHIERALDERERLVDAYREFAEDYNKRARQSVARFLG